MDQIFETLAFNNYRFDSFFVFLQKAFRENSQIVMQKIAKTPPDFYIEKTGIETLSSVCFMDGMVPSINYIIFYGQSDDDVGPHSFMGDDRILVYAVYMDKMDCVQNEFLYDSGKKTNSFIRFTSNDILKFTDGSFSLKIVNNTTGDIIQCDTDPAMWIRKSGPTLVNSYTYSIIQLNGCPITYSNREQADYENLGILLITGPSIELVKNYDYPQLLISTPRQHNNTGKQIVSYGAKNREELLLFKKYYRKYLDLFPDLESLVEKCTDEITTEDLPNYGKIYYEFRCALVNKINQIDKKSKKG